MWAPAGRAGEYIEGQREVFAFDKSTEAALQGYAVGQVGNLRRVGNPLRRLSRLPTGAQDGILPPHALFDGVRDTGQIGPRARQVRARDRHSAAPPQSSRAHSFNDARTENVTSLINVAILRQLPPRQWTGRVVNVIL